VKGSDLRWFHRTNVRKVDVLPRRDQIVFRFIAMGLNNVEYPSRGAQILMSSIALDLK